MREEFSIEINPILTSRLRYIIRPFSDLGLEFRQLLIFQHPYRFRFLFFSSYFFTPVNSSFFPHPILFLFFSSFHRSRCIRNDGRNLESRFCLASNPISNFNSAFSTILPDIFQEMSQGRWQCQMQRKNQRRCRKCRMVNWVRFTPQSSLNLQPFSTIVQTVVRFSLLNFFATILEKMLNSESPNVSSIPQPYSLDCSTFFLIAFPRPPHILSHQ